MLASPRTTRSALIALTAAATLSLTGAAAAQAAVTITDPADGQYINDTTPTVSFTGAGPGDTVELTATGDITTADGNGDGTVTAGASVGTGNLSLQLTDTTTGETSSVNVLVDRVPNMGGTADGSTVDADQVLFNGSAAIPNEPVRLYVDGQLADTETADASGEVTDANGDYINMAPGTLAAGPHTAYEVSVDAYGVESSHSAAVSFDVAPPAPTFPAGSLFDGAQLNQTAPAVTVVGDPAATSIALQQIDLNGNVVGSVSGQPDAGGQVTLTPTLDEGVNTIAVVQTVNGVDSQPSTYIQVTVNSSAPLLDDVASPSTTARPWFDAENLLDNNVNNTTQVVLYVDGLEVGRDDNFGGGTDSLQPSAALAEGDHSAYVTTVDDLGHEGVLSNTVHFRIDTVAPAAPTAVSPADGATLTGSLKQATVHAEPGSTVSLYIDDAQGEGSQVAGTDGTATFNLGTPLTAGKHTLHFHATDAAGNMSDIGDVHVTIAAPAAPQPVATPATTTTQTTPTVPSLTTPTQPVALKAPAAPTKVTLSSHTLTAAKPVTVGFRLRKAGKVKLTLTKVVKGKTKTIATVTIKVRKAGKGTYTLRTKVGGKKLAKGGYKLTLQTVSGKKTSKKVTQKLTVR